MKKVFNPFHFVLIALAGWMNHRQYALIGYLREENRVLRQQLAERRLRFNDDQRRRLTVRAKPMGQRLKGETPIVTWERLLACHRKSIAQKYDGNRRRSPGRPRTVAEIEALVVRMARENRGGECSLRSVALPGSAYHMDCRGVNPPLRWECLR
jgi:hypothetical protein